MKKKKKICMASLRLLIIITKGSRCGVGNNSAIFLRQNKTCTCILYTSVSPKENCPAIHLHMIISCPQLQYIVAIPTNKLITVSLANVIVLFFYCLSWFPLPKFAFSCQCTSYNWDHQHIWTRSLT